MGAAEEGLRGANGLLELKRLLGGWIFDMGLLGIGRFADFGDRLDDGKANPGVDFADELDPVRTCPPANAALGGGSPCNWSGKLSS